MQGIVLGVRMKKKISIIMELIFSDAQVMFNESHTHQKTLLVIFVYFCSVNIPIMGDFKLRTEHCQMNN